MGDYSQWDIICLTKIDALKTANDYMRIPANEGKEIRIGVIENETCVDVIIAREGNRT